MTRIRHLFRHLSAASKKHHSGSREWRLFRLASSIESEHEQVAARIFSLEKNIACMRKAMGDHDRLLVMEEKLARLKKLLPKGHYL
ncbi:hypothetical protein HYU11_02125 [Candidatus Woesearchaeota archaeon]|nr:hypothetical protein [Candidatus Woesearchaeota archaeon]